MNLRFASLLILTVSLVCLIAFLAYQSLANNSDRSLNVSTSKLTEVDKDMLAEENIEEEQSDPNAIALEDKEADSEPTQDNSPPSTRTATKQVNTCDNRQYEAYYSEYEKELEVAFNNYEDDYSQMMSNYNNRNNLGLNPSGTSSVLSDAEWDRRFDNLNTEYEDTVSAINDTYEQKFKSTNCI